MQEPRKSEDENIQSMEGVLGDMVSGKCSSHIKGLSYYRHNAHRKYRKWSKKELSETNQPQLPNEEVVTQKEQQEQQQQPAQEKPLVKEERNYSKRLHIPKHNQKAIYLNVKNQSTYEEVFSSFIKDTVNLRRQISNFIENNRTKLPEDIQKGTTYLIRYCEVFENRLGIAQKASNNNCNSVTDYRENARMRLSDLFNESFISNVVKAIADGVRNEQKIQYYEELIGYINQFLKAQGIYTKSFELKEPIDFELFVPEHKIVIQDPTMDSTIADIYLLPYFFNDDSYEGLPLITEGICVAYSTQ